MRILRAGAPVAVVVLSLLAGCPDDEADAADAGGSAAHEHDSGMVACAKDTPEFVVGEDGLSADGENGQFRVRLVAAKPEVPEIKEETTWTILVTDLDGKPVDAEIAAACAFMPVHGHGAPPFKPIEKLEEPGQYLLDGLYFKMSGPWEVQLAIDPADDGETQVEYTSCDKTKRHPAKDYAVLNVCLADD